MPKINTDKLNDEQKAYCEKYFYVLTDFYQHKKIWNEELRSYLLQKFVESIRNFIPYIPISAYLKNVLIQAYKWYWIDKFRQPYNKEILFSELGDDDQAVAQRLDQLLSPPCDHNSHKMNPIWETYVRLVYKALTWKQQQFVYYRFYQELSYCQIAEMMGISRQNAYRMWGRIKKRFHGSAFFDFREEGKEKAINYKTGEIVE